MPNTVKQTCTISLCLAGAWISGQLLKEHAGPWPSAQTSQTFFTRLCGETSTGQSGCTTLAQSNWSAIDVTLPILTSSFTIERSRVVIPVAFLGLAYFIFLGIWFALSPPPNRTGYWYAVPLSATLAGFSASITLLWIMRFKLDAPCPACLLVHAVNLALLIATLYARPRRSNRGPQTPEPTSQGSPPAPRQTRLTSLGAVRAVAIATIVILGMWVYFTAKLDIRQQVARLLPYKEFVNTKKKDPAFLLREYFAETQQNIAPRPDATKHDTLDSVNTLVVFGDTRCAQCACFLERWTNDFSQNWKTQIRVALRHFPLSTECNPFAKKDTHPGACRAAYATESARRQGGDKAFLQMNAILSARRSTLSDQMLTAAAERLGLDNTRLLADMNDDRIKQNVADDITLAIKLGVTHTPTAFLNGRRIPQLCLSNNVFWKAVATKLELDPNAPKHCDSDDDPSPATFLTAGRSEP